MAIETALKCPQCGELDAVRKVSAIYNGGFSTVQNNSPLVPYGVVDKTITTITPLAQKLTPPTQPNIKKPVGVASRTRRLVFVAIAVLIGIWLIYAGLSVSVDGASLICFGVLLVIGFPVMYFKGESRIRSGKLGQEFNALMEKYNDIISKYELAKFRWDSAYYCGRCDGVFIPDENEFVSINQFQRFIHKFDF